MLRAELGSLPAATAAGSDIGGVTKLETVEFVDKTWRSLGKVAIPGGCGNWATWRREHTQFRKYSSALNDERLMLVIESARHHVHTERCAAYAPAGFLR